MLEGFTTTIKNNLTILLCLLALPLIISAQTIDVKDNFFYIGNEKFFVKGIGYEVGATPGHLPWVRTFNAEIMHSDIQRILKGGFNTIRTWNYFTEQELNLLQAYDLKIIMGIWIDPHGDFASEAFVNNAVSIVEDVLSYSKNYNNIIAYLIMNEPLPEHIANSGYNETVELWAQLIEIIHNQHANRPVSIANASNGTFIDPATFDFSAFNAYVYNPVTVNYLHEYRDFIHYLKQLNTTSGPLILTEYGLSVSPAGPGNWGYGGNSLFEQEEGVLHMYKALVDGGAAGSCVFNYSDGWWKGGNEYSHDNNPEEWFGLVEYTSLSDQFGQERPIWNTIKSFQSAIITQPVSPEIYSNRIPVEIFFNDTIDKIEIFRNNELVYQKLDVNAYLIDTLAIATQGIEDAVLLFRCFDEFGNIVKSEEKNILLSDLEVTLPTIQINVTNSDYWQSGKLHVEYLINRSSDLVTGSHLEYIFYPHVGFNYGQMFEWDMPTEDQVVLLKEHLFAPNVPVITVGAALEATYQGFKKRIVNQLTLSRINDVLNSVEQDEQTKALMHIYPNPAGENIYISFAGPVQASGFSYTIYNILGNVVMNNTTESNQHIDIGNIEPGVYCVQVRLPGYSFPFIQKIAKY